MTLNDYFFDAFERFKERIAYSFPVFDGDHPSWRDLSYNDVKSLVLKLYGYLEKRIKPSQRVIIFAENSPFWCVSYIAIVMRGAIAVPVDVETPSESLENIIADSESVIVLYSSKTEAICKSYPNLKIEKIESLPLPDTIEPADVSEDTIASIIYTSGTTGIPKAVMLTHGNFVFEIEAGKKTGIIKEDDNLLSILPLHHTYPFVCNFLVPFYLGAKVTFSPYLKGPEILRIIKEKKITALVAVPQVLELLRYRIMASFRTLPWCVRSFFYFTIRFLSFLRRRYDINFGKVIFFFIHQKIGFQFRYFTSGGARLDPEVMKFLEALGFTIIEGYGLTETSPVATFNPVDKRKPGSVGKSLEGVEIKIFNPDETGVGEIAIKGRLVMKGYYKNERLTEESIKDNWFLTGDLGYIDPEGYLFITARKKDVIILSSGKTIYPEDVEEKYRKKIPLIKEICLLDNMEAILVPDLEYARTKGIINIYNTLKWEIDAVSSTLPSYSRIKGFRLYNEPLPKTRLGKFKRFFIKDILSTKVDKPTEPHPTFQSGTGKIIAEILTEISPSIENPQLSDHLELDLGMDSLKKIEFVSALEKRFSINITDTTLQRWHTLQDVLNDIETLKSSQAVISKDKILMSGWFFRGLKFVIFGVAYLLLRTLFRLVFFLRVKGVEDLPPPPFIIAPNHTSFLDGFVIFASLPFRISRNLYFQGLKKYFPNKSIAQFMNVIPISSEAELLEAMAISKELLQRGYSLCIFPEGGRSFDRRLREFKPGFAVLSIEIGVPVVPVLIEGTFQILPRGRFMPKWSKIMVILGRPVKPPLQTEEALDFSTLIQNLLTELKSYSSIRPS